MSTPVSAGIAPSKEAPRRLSRMQIALGLVLAFVTLLAIVLTLNDPGITWDEPLYMTAARRYMSWFGLLRRGVLAGTLGEVFSDEAIVAGWMPHPTLELHPPLGKVLSGFSLAALHGVLGDIGAYRFSNAALFALLVAVVFWMVAAAYGTASGVFAALSLMLMPRMFFHAHLANIDTTLAVTWFVAMFVFWKSRDRRGWLPLAIMGLAYGLVFSTKMNAMVMPLIWGVWVLLFHRNWRSVLQIAAITVIGIGAFLISWPWLYHDTANRLMYYALMAFRFKDRPQFYLGETLSHVPWHYPFVITLAVVPLIITIMALLGTFRVTRRKPADSTGWLLILNAFMPLLYAATSLQAAYSGERHFIPAYPYLACLAGIGFGHVLQILDATWHRLHDGVRPNDLPVRWVLGLLLALLLVPSIISMAQLYPYLLSYYSEWVGGLPGATRLGLETTFWCETYRDALPYLDSAAEEGASVWVDNPYVLRAYQRAGLLRQDLKITGGDVVSPTSADFVIIQMRQTGFAYYTPETMEVVESYEPAYTLTRQNVALLQIYDLRQVR